MYAVMLRACVKICVKTLGGIEGLKKENSKGVLVEYDLPCPKCGSSDSLAIYQKKIEDKLVYDGTCYSNCGYIHPQMISDNFDTSNFKEKKVQRESKMITDEELQTVQSMEMRGWRERGIVRAVCEKYGVYTKFDEDGVVHYRYYPCTEGGTISGYHVRNDKIKQARKKDKTVKGLPFFPIGRVRATSELFGQSLFTKGGKYLVITEGQEDCMAVYQALKKDDYETPVVSPHVGSGNSASQIQANFAWVNSFKTIVLMFDNDEAGQEAAAAISKMFGHGKVIVANLTLKDPCEYLKTKGGAQQLRQLFWSAMPKRPSQVLTVRDIYERAMKMPEMGISLPWPSATRATLGVRRGEIHVIGAAPKIGKTEHQHQLIKHFTEVHGEMVGVMSLEEKPCDIEEGCWICRTVHQTTDWRLHHRRDGEGFQSVRRDVLLFWCALRDSCYCSLLGIRYLVIYHPIDRSSCRTFIRSHSELIYESSKYGDGTASYFLYVFTRSCKEWYTTRCWRRCIIITVHRFTRNGEMESLRVGYSASYRERDSAHGACNVIVSIWVLFCFLAHKRLEDAAIRRIGSINGRCFRVFRRCSTKHRNCYSE
ncbi:putative DNA primase/helicase [Nitrincola phage 1M3-16]|uniref:putative DNA primase/helicase n=1 Tax=Nitrincola phage 1M3-16 TaxID=1472912 RepID=UPI000444BA14|nr:putative DNA primase/helicase [Nitrincola phage 1M3-16]AHX01159.1 putative DNA primase/helicase [Nitrincola phage 1M3-16]